MEMSFYLHTPAALPPEKKDGAHWRLAGPQRRSARFYLFIYLFIYFAPAGIRAPDLQPVAYTDYASPAHWPQV
jgi:hypothetical protein